MEINQYRYMFEAEDHHWWYVGNHENFLKILQRQHLLKNRIAILDAGCGTGKWLEMIKALFNVSETGIDYNKTALEYASTRGRMNLQLGDLNQPIFNESSFELITSFDVICNRNIDDSIVLKNLNSYLKDEGYLLITVPAYQFLHSKHDEVVHQNKRYRKKQIKFLLENSGFEIIKISYCVCLLFPIALIKRAFDKLFATKDEEHNEVRMPPKVINHTFLIIMRFENFLLRYLSMPFGLSVVALAKKKSR